MPRISKTNGEPLVKQPLTGAVALVTGGSRGIGRAIARQLAVLGAAVSICGRDRSALKESVRELAKIGRYGSGFADGSYARSHHHPRQQCRHRPVWPGA